MSRKLRGFCDLDGCFSFRSALASICRMRSLESKMARKVGMEAGFLAKGMASDHATVSTQRVELDSPQTELLT